MIKNKKLLSVLQVVFFIFMIAMNALASALKINGYNTGEISALYPNLFVPAGFTFSIWGIIYLLLLAWVAYTTPLLWKYNEQNPLCRHAFTVAPLFIITCVLNIGWLILWQYLQLTLSLLVMLWLLRSLIAVYNKMQQNQKTITGFYRFLLYVPFVVYLAWISVATIANTAALLVHTEWNTFGIEPWLWSCIMIVVATVLSVWFGYVKGELAFSLVIAWALFGIYKGQSFNNSTVSLLAVICCGVSAAVGVAGFIRKSRQTPLEGVI